MPLAFHLTGGEASDTRHFEILLDIGPDIAPRAVLGDKGYDAKANRQAARRRAICPAIPYRDNAAAKPAFFPKILYKGRARAEQGVGKIKRFKRIARAARRRHRISLPSSRSPAPLSWLNPSTRPRIIGTLAGTDALTYERQRAGAAKRLGVRLVFLDHTIERLKQEIAEFKGDHGIAHTDERVGECSDIELRDGRFTKCFCIASGRRRRGDFKGEETVLLLLADGNATVVGAGG